MAIPCKDRVEHRPIAWAVLGRDICRIATEPALGEWPTPGTSTVTCTICHVAWRSSAQYVRSLPDRYPTFVNEIWSDICWYIETYPLLVELTYWQQEDSLAGRSSFLRDVGRQFTTRGRLSAKQRDSAEQVVQYAITRANDQQRAAVQRLALVASLGSRVAPEGPTVVLGRVEEAWDHEPFDGAPGVPKMKVLADEGYQVEGTVPAGIRRQVVALTDLVGRRVKLHVDLSPQSGSLTRAWARRPRPTSKLLD